MHPKPQEINQKHCSPGIWSPDGQGMFRLKELMRPHFAAWWYLLNVGAVKKLWTLSIRLIYGWGRCIRAGHRLNLSSIHLPAVNVHSFVALSSVSQLSHLPLSPQAPAPNNNKLGSINPAPRKTTTTAHATLKGAAAALYDNDVPGNRPFRCALAGQGDASIRSHLSTIYTCKYT